MFGNLWVRSMGIGVLGGAICGAGFAWFLVATQEVTSVPQALAVWSLLGITLGVAGGLAVGFVAGIPASVLLARCLTTRTTYRRASLVARTVASAFSGVALAAVFLRDDDKQLGIYLVASSVVLGLVLGPLLVRWMYRRRSGA